MSEPVALGKLEERLKIALLQRESCEREDGAAEMLAADNAPLMPAPALSIYRRLVRGNFYAAIQQALPITRHLLGRDELESLIGSFLDSSLDSTRVQIRALWQAPATFSAWMTENRCERFSPALAELIHFECVELEILYAPDAPSIETARPPSLASRIEADPSARLLAYRYPVHRISLKNKAFPKPSAFPHFLIAWRSDEKMQIREVSAAVAKVLMYCGTETSLAESIDRIEAEEPPGLDVQAVLGTLAELQLEGALIDFPPGDEL